MAREWTGELIMKRYISLFIILIVIVASSVVLKNIILGNAKVISLNNDLISGVVSTSLQKTSGSTYLPIVNKDFSIGSVHYFDSNNWVVVSLLPVGTSADPGTIVLKDVNGSYQTFFGPANSLQNVDLSSLPADVVTYLKTGK